MRPFKEFLILIGKQSLYFGDGRHKDTQSLQRGEVKGKEIELYIANLLRRIINLQVQNDILTKEDITQLGKMLYNFLKEWNLNVAFKRFYREVAPDRENDSSSNSPFGRIYLEFIEDADLLAILPWEYLSYGDGEKEPHFLGAHKNIKFDLVRRYAFDPHKEHFSYTKMPDPTEKMNVLLIVSEPQSNSQEFGGEQLMQYFEGLHQDGHIGLKIISQPTFAHFSDQIGTLRQEGFQPDIIHFAGEGAIHGDQGYVGFIDAHNDSGRDWVEEKKFLDFLDPFLPRVKLVFLHSCRGGIIGDYRTKKGIGVQLLRSKVPAMLAMQAPVKPEVVFDFAKVFYSSILGGDDLARAVTAGRKKLCFEWQDKPGAGDAPYQKRANPYGDKSFGIPILYITTEEPFPLIHVERKKELEVEEPVIYYECQNKPTPGCMRKIGEKGVQVCPECGGPVIAIGKRGATTRADEGQRPTQPLTPSSPRVPSPGITDERKASSTASSPIFGTREPLKTHADSSLEIILFLAANPKDSSRLRLDEEASRIQKALERSKHREKFDLEQLWAVQVPDLRRALLDKRPGIIHFSGHGSELGRIYLEDASGQGKEVSAEALGNLFKLFKNHIKCVILNACYSELQATEISKHGIPVVGMKSAVPDKAGVAFSEAFYDALGAGENLEFAFELGCNAIEMNRLAKEDLPVLHKP